MVCGERRHAGFSTPLPYNNKIAAMGVVRIYKQIPLDFPRNQLQTQGRGKPSQPKTFACHQLLAPQIKAVANATHVLLLSNLGLRTNAQARTGIHRLPAFAKHVRARHPFSSPENAMATALSNKYDLPLADWRIVFLRTKALCEL